MIVNLFSDLPLIPMWLALAAIGNFWYLLICGGLYLLLHRSRYSDKAQRWKTQRTQPTPKQVRREILDGVTSMSMVPAAGSTIGDGLVFGQCKFQSQFHLNIIRWRHQNHIRNHPQKTYIHQPMMRRSVGTYDPGAVDAKNDWQILHRHFLEYLVETAL